VTTRLHHHISGPPDRATVILGGSIGSTTAAWEPQRAVLAADYQVIAYDHRGHGGSAAPSGPYTIEALGADVLALLDDLDVQRAHWVGLSLGGMVAQHVAARSPQRVDRLVLACTAAHYPDRESWIQRATTVRAGGTQAIADVSLERWLTSDYRRDHPKETARLRQMIVDVDREGYAGCCEAIADMDLRNDLSSIEAPTLVIAGAQDLAVPPDRMRELAAAISDARFEVVHGAHVPSIEHPVVFTSLLLEHLRSTGTAGASLG
jgi:3-oxoadipate enol-lactonase